MPNSSPVLRLPPVFDDPELQYQSISRVKRLVFVFSMRRFFFPQSRNAVLRTGQGVENPGRALPGPLAPEKNRRCIDVIPVATLGVTPRSQVLVFPCQSAPSPEHRAIGPLHALNRPVCPYGRPWTAEGSRSTLRSWRRPLDAVETRPRPCDAPPVSTGCRAVSNPVGMLVTPKTNAAAP